MKLLLLLSYYRCYQRSGFVHIKELSQYISFLAIVALILFFLIQENFQTLIQYSKRRLIVILIFIHKRRTQAINISQDIAALELHCSN
jgi:hypothetical protein